MSPEVVRGRAEPLSESDVRDRQVAIDLIGRSNDVVIAFAKQMAAISLTAVGVVITLADLRGLDETASGSARTALAVIAGAYLVASVLFALALRPRRFPVSLDDYEGSEERLLAAARRRHDLATAGFLLVVAGTLAAIVLLTTFTPE